MVSYTLNNSRLKKSSAAGFHILNDSLVFGDGEEIRSVFFAPIDGLEEGMNWGRFTSRLDYEGEITCKIQVMGTDRKEIRYQNKTRYLDEMIMDETIEPRLRQELYRFGETKIVTGIQDFLLYDIKGRYLWIFIEVRGRGKGSISKIRIWNPGDTFMDVYPDVYREWGSFFHRYLSVFSSVFNDFQHQITGLQDLFDLDKTPFYLLPVLASWLGLDVRGNFLEEHVLRTLVKEAYWLNRKKGTKQAVVRVAEILLDETVILVEKSRLTHYGETQCFGITPYDTAMLVRQSVSEKDRFQLQYILKQFLPVRCRFSIVYLEKKSTLDSHCYFDINGVIKEPEPVKLDDNQTLNYGLMIE